MDRPFIDAKSHIFDAKSIIIVSEDEGKARVYVRGFQKPFLTDADFDSVRKQFEMAKELKEAQDLVDAIRFSRGL